MNSQGSTLFPWAVNGYTTFDGGGVYGSVQSGTTNFAAVQGEYVGTSTIGSGVRGMYMTNNGGTDFANVASGVVGSTDGYSGSYKFGVVGTGGSDLRTGGVMGYDYGIMGGLGYFASNFNDYAVYGFGGTRINGVAGGRTNNNQNYLDTSIGLGIYGGVIGGWINGNEYGTVVKGDRFANYTLGKNITNESFVVLDKKEDGSKAVSYAATSMTIDIQDKGVGKLTNGTSTIAFDRNYSEILDDTKPIIVTITPIGESNGVHIVSVDKNGFTIKENNNGSANISFNWIVIAEKKSEATPVSKEILQADFDSNLEQVMHNDSEEGGKAIWSENGTIHFGDRAPENTERLKKQSKQATAMRARTKE